MIFKSENFDKIENHFLDWGVFSALLVLVSTLGLSLQERVCSRILFYVLVFSGLGVMNRFLPDRAEAEAAKWESLGVARTFIVVPYGQVERELFRQSK